MNSIQEANVVALLVQASLYGFYFILLIRTLRWLVFEDSGWTLRRKINRLMLSTTILFFVFSTSDLWLSLGMSIAAMRGQTTKYNKYGTVNNTIENTTILLADAVLIYRCWIVYAKSWLVIFVPVLMWLVALSCSVLVICSQLIVGWESRFYHLWAVFYCSNILTNIYATAAIVFAIFKTTMYTFRRQSQLHKVSRILFESGFLYTLTSFVNLASSIVAGPPIIRYISDAVNFSMTGIAFNLLLIRVSEHRCVVMTNDVGILNSSVTLRLSGLNSPSHTSEHSTPTMATSNEESYIEAPSRVNTPLLNSECGSNGFWQDFTYTSASKDTIYSTNPVTADRSYSWTY